MAAILLPVEMGKWPRIFFVERQPLDYMWWWWAKSVFSHGCGLETWHLSNTCSAKVLPHLCAWNEFLVRHSNVLTWVCSSDGEQGRKSQIKVHYIWQCEQSVFYCLSKSGSLVQQAQQRSQDTPLSGHFHWLLWEDLKTFPSQLRDTISLGSIRCPNYLNWPLSIWRSRSSTLSPSQMAEIITPDSWKPGMKSTVWSVVL